MKVCVICGGELLTGAKKYCPKCKEVQYEKDRKKSRLKFIAKIDKLEPIRTCKKCGLMKRHNAKCNVCPDCYSPKHKLVKEINRPVKPIKKSKEDALFESLLNRRIKEMSIYGEKIPKIRERKCLNKQ